MKILGLCGYKQSGKSTLAQVARTDFNFRRMGFADELKNIIQRLWPAFTEDHMFGELKEEVVEEYGKSFREVVQHVGTDLFRAYDPDVWVRSTRQAIEHYEHQMGRAVRPLVIDDLRFDNEAELIHELGGEVWEVSKGESRTDSHLSEQGLTIIPDRYIGNTGSLNGYKALVKVALEDFVDER